MKISTQSVNYELGPVLTFINSLKPHNNPMK